MDEQGNSILDKNRKQAYRAVSITGWSRRRCWSICKKTGFSFHLLNEIWIQRFSAFMGILFDE